MSQDHLCSIPAQYLSIESHPNNIWFWAAVAGFEPQLKSLEKKAEELAAGHRPPVPLAAPRQNSCCEVSNPFRYQTPAGKRRKRRVTLWVNFRSTVARGLSTVSTGTSKVRWTSQPWNSGSVWRASSSINHDNNTLTRSRSIFSMWEVTRSKSGVK